MENLISSFDNPGKRNETRKSTKFVVAFGDTAMHGKLFMHFNAKILKATCALLEKKLNTGLSLCAVNNLTFTWVSFI